MRRYLAIHRPRLLGASRSDRLWINRRGRPLASTALYPLFARIGNQMIGRPIHPHLVRHSLATTLLGEHPGRMRLAADALTHRTQGQLSATYDRSGNTAALRVWRRLIRRTQSGSSRP